MNVLAIVVIVIIVLGIAIGTWICWRFRKAIRKVWLMTPVQRVEKINQLAEKLGFYYESAQNIFLTRMDAWQRKYGYADIFDDAALRMKMVFDRLPVYFDYDDKSWLIEFWKGQYGICTGSEIGIYNVPFLVADNKRDKTHYRAVADSEMLDVAFVLYRNGERFYVWGQKHWWLGAFRPGLFSETKDLRLRIRIIFPNVEMALAFVKGLKKTEYAIAGLERNCTWVTIDFGIQDGKTSNYFIRAKRKRVQRHNKLMCKIYTCMTRPFHKPVDQILFLYYMFPAIVRHYLHTASPKKCVRKRYKCMVKKGKIKN